MQTKIALVEAIGSKSQIAIRKEQGDSRQRQGELNSTKQAKKCKQNYLESQAVHCCPGHECERSNCLKI